MAILKRLSKVARELNVGISTIVEFLSSQNKEVSSNPNTKIGEELYMLLLQEFQKEKFEKEKADNVDAWLVPGSHKVLKSIKDEGILDTLTESGFKLREPGCSACLAMNDDKVPAGKYAVSTSNRNFEGRQGPGSRTLLASPLVAAAAAITGKITDPRTLL